MSGYSSSFKLSIQMLLIIASFLLTNCQKKKGKKPELPSETPTEEGIAPNKQPEDGNAEGNRGSNQSQIPAPPSTNAFNILGLPTKISNLNNLLIRVSATDSSKVTHYRYKIGSEKTTNCAAESFYSASLILNEDQNIDLTSVNDGNIKFCLQGIKNKTVLTSMMSEYVWLKDTLPPQVELPANKIVTGKKTQLSLLSNEEVKINWSLISGLGGINFSNPNSLLTDFVANQDGTYEVKATAIDSAGNVAEKLLIIVWDQTPPTIENLGDIRTKKSFTIQPRLNEGTAFLWEQIEGTPDVFIASTTTANADVTFTREGTYKLRFSVWDEALNRSYKEISVTVDQTGPSLLVRDKIITKDLIQLHPVYSNDTVGFLWTQISGPSQLVISDVNLPTPLVSAKQDGLYILRLKVIDDLGNSTEKEQEIVWDTKSPQISTWSWTTVLTDGFLNSIDRSTSSQLIANMILNEDGQIAYKSIFEGESCDNHLTFEATIPKTTDSEFFRDGIYAICLQLTDLAGNTDYFSSPYFNVDTRLPNPTALVGLPQNPSRSPNLELHVENSNDVKKIRYQIGPAALIDCNKEQDYLPPVFSSVPLLIDTKPFGTTTVKFCWIGADEAGNWQPASESSSYIWFNDLKGPESPEEFFTQIQSESVRLKWKTTDPQTTSFLLVRQIAGSQTWQPVDGRSYSVGSPSNDLSSIIVSGFTQRFYDIGLEAGKNYVYTLYAADQFFNYSIPKSIAALIPAKSKFNKAHGFNGTIKALLSTQFAPGKLYAGGDFTVYENQYSARLIRLNEDYSMDSSFILGGGFNGTVNTITEGKDGSIYVGGNFTSVKGVATNRIIRLKYDGSIDTSFNVGTGFNGVVNVISYDANLDMVYVGGAFSIYNGLDSSRLIRLRDNGIVDSTFSIGTGFNNQVHAIAVESANSGLWVGGQFTEYNGTTANRMIKLKEDGSVDNSFAYGSGFNNTVYSIVHDSASASTFVGGSFTTYQGTTTNRLARLNHDGSQNTTLAIGLGFNSSIKSIAFGTSSAQIIIGGDFTSYQGNPQNKLVVLSEAGTIDTSLAVESGFDGTVNALSVSSANSILVGGSFVRYREIGCNRFGVLLPSGTLDQLLSSGSGLNNIVYATAINTDELLYTLGSSTQFNGMSHGRVGRFLPNGDLDNQFNANLGFGPTSAIVNQGIFDKSLKRIYLGGSFTTFAGLSQNRVAAILENGNLDNGFLTGQGFNNTVQAMDLKAHGGSIYLGGKFTTYDNNTANRIILLKNDGSIDTEFIVGTGFNGDIWTIKTARGGGLYVGGAFTSYNSMDQNRIIKLKDNGDIDPSFIVGTGFNGTVYALLEDSSGLIVGGNFTSYRGSSYNRIIRLLNDGSIDSSFSAGSGFNSTVLTLTKDEFYGDVFVGGQFTQYRGLSFNRMVKIDQSGLVVPEFNIGSGFNGDVRSISVTSQGIYVGGSFTSYRSQVTGSAIKLLHEGSLD